MCKYDLVGVDSNAFHVLAYTANAMKKEGFTKQEIEEMRKEATESNYDMLIATCMDYLDKCNERAGEEND